VNCHQREFDRSFLVLPLILPSGRAALRPESFSGAPLVVNPRDEPLVVNPRDEPLVVNPRDEPLVVKRPRDEPLVVKRPRDEPRSRISCPIAFRRRLGPSVFGFRISVFIPDP
jgi:hypothetical protein